jgi:spermidine/putrescine transport system ATP-binding protein
VLGVPPNKRNVKMVFQHLALFPMMNVGENIAYGLRCRGENKAAITDKVKAVLDRIGLPDVAEKEISQLSGGQRQRIAIARCMVLEPDVLLLDEPLGALDLKLRERMKIELKLLQHQFDTTFLYITHDQSEALVMSDNVAVMNAGRFEQIGAPHELYHKPQSGFVAGFVGDSNRWRGRVKALAGGEARVEIEGGEIVAKAAGPDLSVGGFADVFVRPENLGLSADSKENRIDGVIDSYLFNGANSRVLVRTAGGELIEVAQAGSSESARPGSAVSVGWARDQGLCFGAAG